MPNTLRAAVGQLVVLNMLVVNGSDVVMVVMVVKVVMVVMVIYVCGIYR